MAVAASGARRGVWAPQRLAWPVALSVLAVIACLFIVGTVLQAEDSATGPGVFPASLTWAVGLFAYPLAGVLVVQRHPGSAVGWLLLGIGLAFGTGVSVDGISARIADADAAAVTFLFGGAAFQTGFVLVAMLLLVFPTGHVAGRGWRWVAIGLWVLLGASFVGLFSRVGPVDGPGSAPNPWAMPPVAAIAGPVSGAPGFLMFGVLLIASAVSVFLRFRRADDDLRAQLLWFTLGAGVLAVVFLLDGVMQLWIPDPGPAQSAIGTILEGLAFAALAAAIAVAMLRNRLFDVDRLAVRSLGYSALAVIATAAYVVVVSLAGAVFGGLGLSGAIAPFLAAAVIAIAFQPLRVWLLRLGARVVLGRRATPYQVLSEMSRRVSRALSTADALPAIATALADAIGGTAQVWLAADDGLVLAAVAPEGDPARREADSRSPRGEGFDVVQGGQVLGVLAIDRATPLTSAERGLVGDLASQAGIVLRNAQLSAELEQRLDDLRSTAARLTAATESERRRLERDLHDGVQQQLTALTMRIGAVRSVAATDPAAVPELLAGLAADSTAAMATVRELSRGVFPPLLAASGPRAALTARARQAPMPVVVRCPDDRLPAPVEAAVYFCCAEALQNATKHSASSRVEIVVSVDAAELSLRVHDDGTGFDVPTALGGGGMGLHNMGDRFTALGGTLRIDSDPADGTTITGRLPIRHS